MTTLRLGFALGGGVSLGAFSGGALSETIKLILLDSAQEMLNGNTPRYSQIEIDVFSGASAGALSLGLMLHSLITRTSEQEEQAYQNLIKEEYLAKNELDRLKEQYPECYQDLMAAQVLQDQQKEAWVDRIDIANLIPYWPLVSKLPEEVQDKIRQFHPKTGNLSLRDILEPRYEKLKYKCSLFDRQVVDDIARTLFSFHSTQRTVSLHKRRLLAKRVVFATTLTNLHRLQYDARNTFIDNESMVQVASRGGLRSTSARDSRVFDINFTNLSYRERALIIQYPPHWYRLHMGDTDTQSEHPIFDIESRLEWASIVSTCIASSAVPLAFEPVYLKRYRWEYGNEWPTAFKNESEAVLPFIDGGAFNNEPIEEAFRLAAFIDSQPTEAQFERRIIYIDSSSFEKVPAVHLPIQLHLKSEEKQRDSLSDDDGMYNDRTHGNEAVELSEPQFAFSLDRLVPHVSTMINLLLREGRVIDAHRKLQTRNPIKLRDCLWTLTDKIEPPSDLDKRNNYIVEIKAYLQEQVEEQLQHQRFPTTSGAIEELLWVFTERRKTDPTVYKPLGESATAQVEIKRLWDMPNITDNVNDAVVRCWIQLLLAGLISVVLSLSRKSTTAKLLAIAPYKKLHYANSNPLQQPEADRLPLFGEAFGAFAGFLDPCLSEYDEYAGRYCAGLFLGQEDGEQVYAHLGKSPKARSLSHLKDVRDQLPEKQIKTRMRVGVNLIKHRIKELVTSAEVVSFAPLFDKFINEFIGYHLTELMKLDSILDAMWKDKPLGRQVFNLRLIVSDKNDKLSVGYHTLTPSNGLLETVVTCDFHRNKEKIEVKAWHGFYLQANGKENAKIALRCSNHSKVPNMPNDDLVYKAIIKGASGFVVDLNKAEPEWCLLVPDDLATMLYEN